LAVRGQTPIPSFSGYASQAEALSTVSSRVTAPLRVAALLVAAVATISGAEWPQFRGPARDNFSTEKGLIRTWPTGGPKVLWKTAVADGYAGAAIKGGTVYVNDYDLARKAHLVRAISLATGKDVWQWRTPVDIRPNHGITRTVPAVGTKLLFSLDPKCRFYALDAKTGTLVWQKNLVQEYKATIPGWYAGQNPLLDGDRVVLATGGDALAVAFDQATGKEIWRTPNAARDVMSHASLMPTTIGGVKQFLYLTMNKVGGIAAADGALLWSIPFATGRVPARRRVALDTRGGNGTIEIRIGVGSCGRASGADAARSALEDTVAAFGGGATVKAVGCRGLCHHEPLVEVIGDGPTRLCGYVTPDEVRKIVREHVRPGSLLRSVREDVNDLRSRLLDDRAWEPIADRAVDPGPYRRKQVRIVLENCGEIDPLWLADYLRRDGMRALETCLKELAPEDVVERVRASGLSGRGGAGFPTATKWDITRRAEGTPKYVICNADEGDPGAFMDRAVLESDPFRVIEGLAIAAYATGASHGIVYVRSEYPIALRRGPAAFAAYGTEDSKGTRIFSLTGKVRRTGLIEVPMGITVREIVEEIGGGVPEGRRFKAVLAGGPSGGCIPASLADTRIDYEDLTATGAIMGSGGLVVLDDRDCAVEMARYFLHFTQILDAARGLGIRIPTLCHVDGYPASSSCFLCAVQVEGKATLSPSCVMPAADGMVVRTNTDDIRASRKMALELLLSDHAGDCVGPCMTGCPARFDIPGLLTEMAAGNDRRSAEIASDFLALPAALGRIGPRLCEQRCHRCEAEAALSAGLHRFAADRDLASGDRYLPRADRPTGKRVAIVGAGPAGLSAAYYLLRRGHDVAVFDAHDAPGGMLRYGIPAFRLPPEVLDREIEIVRLLGAEFRMRRRLGADMTLDDLPREFDAVFLAIGAQGSRGLDCPGEGLSLSALTFLEQVASGRSVDLGDEVVVIGGGNTDPDGEREPQRENGGARSGPDAHRDLSLVQRRKTACRASPMSDRARDPAPGRILHEGNEAKPDATGPDPHW
jgi:(2Fe-2S) ferredoxin